MHEVKVIEISERLFNLKKEEMEDNLKHCLDNELQYSESKVKGWLECLSWIEMIRRNQ